jgi:hypothetical protein
MQAVVLIEAYSIFKSRRPPQHFSKHFETVYTYVSLCAQVKLKDVLLTLTQLANNPIATSLELSDDRGFHDTRTDLEGYHDYASWIVDAHSKQRLLVCCFLLDDQHSKLFGRSRTPCFTQSTFILPFPVKQSLWDLPGEYLTLDQTARANVWQAIDMQATEETSDIPRHDIFQTQVLMATLGDALASPNTYYPVKQPDWKCSLAIGMEQSPRAKLGLYTMKLCCAAPIRELMAVAGESWVMSEKISTREDFGTAQRNCKAWAEDRLDDTALAALGIPTSLDAINVATSYALKILELHWSHPRTGLPFQEWSLYLASLVIWAKGYFNKSNTKSTLRLSVPQPSEPRLSTQELDRAVLEVINKDPSNDIDDQQAKNVLLWTKTQLERTDVPHVSGLTNCALDVLGKLVARGSEDGWFGP